MCGNEYVLGEGPFGKEDILEFIGGSEVSHGGVGPS